MAAAREDAAGEKDYMAYFNKIKAKHTDFVLCDPDTLEILCGVELDDPSHDRPERIERDEFVDHVYEAAGIPLIHVWMPITEKELEKELLAVIQSLTDQTAEDTETPQEKDDRPDIIITGLVRAEKKPT